MQVPLYLRRGFLRAAWPRLGNVHERVSPHHRRLHRREICGDLPSVPLADSVESISRGQADPGHMAGGIAFRVTAGPAVRRGPA